MKLPSRDKWNSPKDEVQYDPAQIAYMGLIFNPSRPVVDVGANVGKVARFLALRTRETVTCFEPAPSTFAVLQEHTKDLPNVVTVQAAVAHKKGRSHFIGEGTVTAHLSNGKRGNTIAVDVVTLDESLDSAKDVGLLKIDVEGTELLALEGASKIIAKFRPLLVIEMIDDQLKRGGGSRRAIFEFLRGYGYTRAVNKYGMTEAAENSTGASDVFFLPDRDWYAPRLHLGYAKMLKRDPSQGEVE